MNADYQYTQRSGVPKVCLWLLFGPILLTAAMSSGLLTALSKPAIYFLVMIGLFVPMMLLGYFSPYSLTITATDKGLHVKMGIGISTYYIPWNEISSAERTRVPFWLPSGMQYLLWLGVALIASRGEAVRIQRKYATPVLISTDDPISLLLAIETHLEKAGSGVIAKAYKGPELVTMK
jgi:hypothetical protein